MTQDERSTIDEVARVLRDATRDYTGHRTIGEWAKLAAKTIERLRTDLKEATESQQRLTLDNACWQAENRKIGNELIATKKAIACLEAANTEFARIAAESIRPMPTWTSTTPTEPADYWVRGPRLTHGSELVRLYRVDSGEMRMDEGRIVPDDLEWWGPVPRPPEKRGGSSCDCCVF